MVRADLSGLDFQKWKTHQKNLEKVIGLTKLEFTNDSWIKKVTYDTETKEMTIFDSKKSYTCVGVDQSVYDAFNSAPSKGSYFNSVIKGKFSHQWFK